MAVVVFMSDGSPLSMPDPSQLSAAARRTLAGVWTYRADAEREAERRFARLARELRAVEAPAEAITITERAVFDEHRHAILCKELATIYGGEAPQLRAVEDVPLGPKQLDFRDRVLYEVVAFCCITETLNSSLMKVAFDAARVPEVRAALRAILRDEIGHARIGWAHLAAERARGRGELIAALVPRMLAGAIREELFSPGPESSDAASLRDHGELPESIRLSIFEAAARDVIVPGLEELGIDTRPMREWMQRMKSAGDRRVRDRVEEAC